MKRGFDTRWAAILGWFTLHRHHRPWSVETAMFLILSFCLDCAPNRPSLRMLTERISTE